MRLKQNCLYVPCKDMSPNLKWIYLVSGWLGWQSACTMWRGSGFDSHSQAICFRSSSVKLKTKKQQIGPQRQTPSCYYALLLCCVVPPTGGRENGKRLQISTKLLKLNQLERKLEFFLGKYCFVHLCTSSDFIFKHLSNTKQSF